MIYDVNKLKRYIKILSELDLEKNSDSEIVEAFQELTAWLNSKD